MMRKALAVLLFLCAPAMAQNAGPVYGSRLEGFAYPYPVRIFRFTSQRAPMEMAYMDVKPAVANGRTIVLLHRKNFCAATWEGSIRALTAAGYRVIAPDQIGWCKSIKPEHYQYTFEQLAANTHALLESLGIGRAIVMGHSTGGMLAIRYGLLYPADTQQLVLVDPLGLEDWRAKGVPWRLVVRGHALPNAAIPTVTVVGFMVGTLIAGAVVVESVFSWPGVGRLLIVAVSNRDLAVVQCILLLVAGTMVSANLIVDLLYGVLDPRLRAGAAAGAH